MIKLFEFTKDYKRSNIYANLNPLNVNNSKQLNLISLKNLYN